MLQVELFRPSALSASDRAAWRELQAAERALTSPLLSPEFAEAVGRVRPDATVAVYRRAGRAVAFLAHHRRPGGMARPMGAPFSDVHALISEPGDALEGAQALSLAGIKAFRFSSLADPQGRFGLRAETARQRFVIELGEQSGADYLESLRAASAKRFKNWRRLDHKLERERGELSLVGPDRDGRAFELLLHWKREQLRRSGLHDVYRPAWVQGLMRQLFATREGPLQGLMLTLRVEGRLAAGHFGVRQGDAFHPWIASIDPDLADYSPGQTFLSRAILAMPGLGLRTYDLSAGHDHYKAPYASRREPIFEGVAFAAGARPAPSLFASLGVTGERLDRRLDQIASVDLSPLGRARGVLEAARAWRLRDRLRTPLLLPEPAE